MKIIFLDIDGVMNCMATAYQTRRKGFDLIPSALLRRIIQETGAKIVVSGALGRAVALDILRGYFERAGIPGDTVIGVTDTVGRRGEDISQWLHAHPEGITGYILIDDADAAQVAPHENVTVRTNWFTGMSYANAEQAIAFLNQQRHP